MGLKCEFYTASSLPYTRNASRKIFQMLKVVGRVNAIRIFNNEIIEPQEK